MRRFDVLPCRPGREQRREIAALDRLHFGHHRVAFGWIGGHDQWQQRAYELDADSRAPRPPFRGQVGRAHGQHRLCPPDDGVQKALHG
jgi:hypothetical protein